MAAEQGNQYAIGNNGGRPPIYDSAEQLISACEGYFQYIKTENEPPTVTGLALHLGFESRQSLYDYGKKDEFSYIIKRAKLLVEHGYEKALGGEKVTGAIFALKNMGWADKTDITSDGKAIQGGKTEVVVRYEECNVPLPNSEDDIDEDRI